MGIETATLAAVGSVLSGVAGVGGLATSLFGGGSAPQPPQAVREPQQRTPTQAQDPRRQASRAAAATRGGTILTSPLGLTSPASNARPMLLGS